MRPMPTRGSAHEEVTVPLRHLTAASRQNPNQRAVGSIQPRNRREHALRPTHHPWHHRLWVCDQRHRGISVTFILAATREVPKRLANPRKRTVGVRIPNHPVVRALLRQLGKPLVSSTLLLPGEDEPMHDGWAIKDRFDHDIDAVIDSGAPAILPRSCDARRRGLHGSGARQMGTVKETGGRCCGEMA
jgi:hypothetical protein